ncbi:MAG: diaminopimelate epimerase [Caldithrix sp. RBG_13_44_9]|nr:MAG: diaminopimelate epimerase [Caldithrix sp. RBG_13_44_9]
MRTTIPFFKIHGSGNDFILIDNRKQYFTGTESQFIQRLCRRRWGIGADGLMLIEFRRTDQFELRYFNADGTEAAMCANGARCAVYFMHLLHPDKKKFSFHITGQSYRAQITGERRVKVFWQFFPEVTPIPDLAELINENFRQFLFVNTGVPHLIVNAEVDVDKIDLVHWGAFYRNHASFGEQGTNVNFVNFSAGGIRIRSYERGIEGETLSCGTGVLAAASAGKYWKHVQWPVNIETRGGRLIVGEDPADKVIWLEGPVQSVYKGTFTRADFPD